MRTLSNSLTNKNSSIGLFNAAGDKLDLKDFKERWLTKKELLMQDENSPRKNK